MSSTFAVDGLASGLDTRAIIAQLMDLERRPLTQLKSQQTREQARIKAMGQFKGTVSSLASAVTALADRAKINAKLATTDTPSSVPAVLTATAGADAVNGTYRVTVSQLATSTKIASSGAMGQAIDPTVPLASAGFKFLPVHGSFTINGRTITTTETTTLNSLLADINASGAGVTASLTADNNHVQIAGTTVQLGAIGDTSNAARLLNLADAVITPDGLVSTANLGVTDVAAPITGARLQTAITGLDGTNSGKFTINGVEINYKGNESLTTILNRINASSAGVTAFYDPVQDTVRLSAGQTGARSITMSDTTGNFLAATRLTGGTQTLGQNALFSIEGVNGGAQLSSATNSVSGYLPGISLDLKSTSATPVTVTVGQDNGATSATLGTFVEQFNAVADAVERLTKYDKDTKRSSTLTGDRAVNDVERQLRSLINSPAIGATGKYRSLADIGISTGAIGAAVGAATRLQLDETKLAAALRDNPQAVENVLTSFSATLGAPSGPNVTAVSGSPTKQHEAGTYKLKVIDATNKVEISFVTTDGRTLSKTSGIMTPGQANTSLVPGLTITAAGALTVGTEDTFTMTPTARGVGVGLNDYLDRLLGQTGFFANREVASNEQLKNLAARVEKMEERLKTKEASLNRKFATLESTMARLQSQGSALSAQLTQLNAQKA